MLIDTSAWVEYFLGTKKGEKVKEVLESKEEIFTHPLTIAELAQWSDKAQLDTKNFLSFVYAQSDILEISLPIFEDAGIRYNKLRKLKGKIGMIDVIIYVSAITHGLSFLTCDNDFSGFPAVEMIT